MLTTTVIAYWLCDAIGPGNLRLGSSIVTLGLSWQTAVGIIALGHFLISLVITANGIIGARLHIPYTIQSRASFGFYCSFLVVIIRMIVGLFWYGINTYSGALCIKAVLLAIWPSFANVPNHLPGSANITTQLMTGMSSSDAGFSRSLTGCSLHHLLPLRPTFPLHTSTKAHMVLQRQSDFVPTSNLWHVRLGM